MAYAMDDRVAVAAAYDDCGSSIEVAERFGCSESWVRCLIQHRREDGTLEPRSSARPDDQRTYDDADEQKIRALIRIKLDATLVQVAQTMGRHGHWKVISTIAAMPVRGIEASASFDGATDTELFVTFVRAAWVPTFVPGHTAFT